MQSAGLIFFPLLFLTPNFVPRDLLTRPMEIAASINPVTYVMEALRQAVDGLSVWTAEREPDLVLGAEPDVVLGCAGDIPTLEVLAATAILREHLPELKVRVVNVVDLMCLPPLLIHPHGLEEAVPAIQFLDLEKHQAPLPR